MTNEKPSEAANENAESHGRFRIFHIYTGSIDFGTVRDAKADFLFLNVNYERGIQNWKKKLRP